MSRVTIIHECFTRVGDGPAPSRGAPRWRDGEIVIIKSMAQAERVWNQMLARNRVTRAQFNSARQQDGSFQWPWTDREKRAGFIFVMELDPLEVTELAGPAYADTIADWDEVPPDEPMVAQGRALLLPEDAEAETSREKFTAGEIAAIRDSNAVVEPERGRLIDPESATLRRTRAQFEKRQ